MRQQRSLSLARSASPLEVRPQYQIKQARLQQNQTFRTLEVLYNRGQKRFEKSPVSSSAGGGVPTPGQLPLSPGTAERIEGIGVILG